MNFSFVRRLMFADSKKLIRLARTKILQAEDMPPLPKHLDPRHLSFPESALNTTSGRSFIFSLYRAGRHTLLPALALNLCFALMNLMKPVLVNSFVARISQGIQTDSQFIAALVLAVLLGSVSFVASLFLQHYFMRSLWNYQMFTNVINRMLFRHSLFLSQKARGETQLGDVVNHMASDSDAVSDLGIVTGDLQATLVTIVGVTALMFYYLGTTAFVSLAVLSLIIPLTRIFARSFSKLDEELMKHRDQRVTLMSQALNGIRVVKYFAWEKSVSKEVGVVRGQELHARKKLARAEALSTLSYTAISTVVLFTTLAVHIYRGRALTPELAFTCVALFTILEDPLGHLSEYISKLATAFVSAGRICAFLRREKLSSLATEESDQEVPGIEIDEVSIRYPGQEKNTLEKINLRLLPGESLAVVGPVGCGKSTFLQALLREVPLQSGNLSYVDARQKSLQPRIAYVPQEAFIVNGSLKENILFGEKEDAELFQRALFSSCLSDDLGQLPAGIFTEIGERGVNLSGGQKQRVSLARAIAHQPKLVLLDDPLSAVDARTETQLVERLIFGEWRAVTRVVVTHRLAHLVRFDKIAFIEHGKLQCIGSLADLLANPLFVQFYSESAKTEDGQHLLAAAKENSAVVTPGHTESRVTEDEDRAVGAVKNRVYLDYVRALGGKTPLRRAIMIPILIGGTIAGSALPMLQKSWLALSSNFQSGKLAGAQTIWEQLAATPFSSVLVYGGLGLVTLSGVLLNRLFWLERGVAAGRDLHNGMLESVLKAPLRFFDSTPMGRILQRFSRDAEQVDIHLQWSFELTVRCLINIATSLFLILTVLPVMLFVALPVLWLYYTLQRDYRIPARETKRLDSIHRSPRYAHFKETLQGLVVIRSFGKTNYFLEGFFDRLHQSQKMFHGLYMLNRWFSSRIPLLGGFISSSTAIGIVFYARAGWISPGMAGLVVVYALSLWESLNWAVRIFSDVEAQMTSVERIRYYTALEKEQSVSLTPEISVDTKWPLQGEIVFDRVVARYAAHLPPVLKGISFRIPAGARVGVIGRTGSGKSTLLQALFRCMEIEAGEIRIDGQNIASVPLERLRRSLAIIPQDPTLFLGTLRSNLDRYSEYSDEEIWLALRKTRLEEFVRAHAAGLLMPMQEHGHNLSQGQRQLLCLARALLSEAKVIVMDEATASVDVRTDNLVQEVVRESCKDVTMLIIAHRLGTVADCDLIFEVREGKLHRTLDLKKQETAAPIC